MDKMRKIYKRVKGKWMKHAPELYWGDDLDVRYYLISQLKKLENKKILDIGCGTGIICSELDVSNDISALDNSKEMIKIAKEEVKNCKFILGDMYKLPFKASTFDIVILANVIEISDLRKELIFEVHRVLKKGGILFLTTPNRAYSYYKKWGNKLKYKELRSLLNRYFKSELWGYNPFPKFLPSKIFVRMPAVHIVLNYLANKKYFVNKGRAFYVEAVKV